MLRFEWQKSTIWWCLFCSVAILSCKPVPVLTRTDTQYSLTPVVSNPPDSRIDSMILPYKNQLDGEMNRVIGRCPVELTEASYQSTLGNFVIDLILAQSELAYGNDIDMAVVTNGGLRTPMAAGEVTVGDIFELMPFNNELVVLQLPGESVIKMMSYAAIKGNAIFAGVQYTVKNGQPYDVVINGAPFDYDKVYTVAVSDYLASGGDKMTFLTEAVYTQQLGILFRDAILNHITALTEQGKVIEGKLDNRVNVEN